MTASIIRDGAVPVGSFGRFAGLGALVRKDTTEWLRGRRAWIVLVITATFMVLSAANSWINAQIIKALPPGVDAPDVPVSMAPFDNLLAAVGTQIFVLAAIFAVASLIIRERESGTLAWVASKPVSRSSIWLAKWLSSTAILAVAAVVVPFVVTSIVVATLYGMPSVGAIAIVAIGATATVAFYAALGLAAGTAMPGQPAIVATGFGVFALLPVLASLVPLPIEPFLPTSILGWSVGLASGADVGVVTPVAWAIGTALLVGFATRRMNRIEL